MKEKLEKKKLGAEKSAALVPLVAVPAFLLVTVLFALWGFANDITNPMVAAFKNILLISNFESSLVQFAFYGGYMVMAFPAAFFIKRFSYKLGILVGLGLYALGCFLFIPSGWMMEFWAFLLSYFIMTCGLSFLETCANPFILSMGDKSTATRRLNFAQSFNPMGSLAGMFVARNFILQKLNPMDETARLELQKQDPTAFDRIAEQDFSIVVGPYAILGAVVAAFLLLFLFVKLPNTDGGGSKSLDIVGTFRRLFRNSEYVMGVVAQMFYVGVQIMCWTFIIQYAGVTLGLTKADSQFYNILAMVMFVTFRFVCTFLLKYFNPGLLLLCLAFGGAGLILMTIFSGGNPEAGSALTELLNNAGSAGFMAKLFIYLKAPFVIPGMVGLVALVLVSSCMSLMFPTIYGIALHNVGADAKIASAGLIMAIGGGCIMTPLQGLLMDQKSLSVGGGMLSSAQYSFVLPLICFIVIALYGMFTYVVRKRTVNL